MKTKTWRRPTRGSYVVQSPTVVAFTRQDVLSPDWDQVRESILKNVVDLYDDAIFEVEEAIRRKK